VNQRLFNLLLVVAAVWVSGVVAALPARALEDGAAELRREYLALRSKFAADVPGLIPASPGTGAVLCIASDEYSSDRAHQVRGDHAVQCAEGLFALAKRAASGGELSLAFQWATEALHANPDHADARRVLGYEQHEGQWLTEYGKRQAEARQPKVWHAKFGWIGPMDAPRYEAGERFTNNRWVTAEQDAKGRQEIADGWSIRTDHFLVRTNHSLEAAAELAGRLERLHQLWRQLFARFYLSDREVRELFAGNRPPRRQRQPMRVYYYRTKSEYVSALAKRQPRIAETLGIYFDVEKEAHFYGSDDQDATLSLATLQHEAVHQMFQESRPAARNIGALANTWIVEGIATYFESLRERRDESGNLYYTIGEADAGRLPAARERVLRDNFYVPLSQLTQFGKDELQRQPELAKLYTQSAGLATFLMDGEAGRFREPLVRYLTEIYAGRDDARTLATVTGVSLEDLDAGYRRFLGSLP
jgi:hypothetical protein